MWFWQKSHGNVDAKVMWAGSWQCLIWFYQPAFLSLSSDWVQSRRSHRERWKRWRRVILGYLCPWLPSYGIALGWLCPSTKGHYSAFWRSQLLSRQPFLYESLFVVSGNCPLPSVVTSSGLALSLLVPLYPYCTLINSPLLNKSQFCPSLWLIYSFS